MIVQLSCVPGLARFSVVASLLLTSWAVQAQEGIERRVNALLAQRTLEEAGGRLHLVSHGPPLRWEDISEGKAGSLLNFNSAQDVARPQAPARQPRPQTPPHRKCRGDGSR